MPFEKLLEFFLDAFVPRHRVWGNNDRHHPLIFLHKKGEVRSRKALYFAVLTDDHDLGNDQDKSWFSFFLFWERRCLLGISICKFIY